MEQILYFSNDVQISYILKMSTKYSSIWKYYMKCMLKINKNTNRVWLSQMSQKKEASILKMCQAANKWESWHFTETRHDPCAFELDCEIVFAAHLVGCLFPERIC